MSAVGVLSAAVMAPLFALLTVMSVDMPGGMESGVGARSDHASDGAGGTRSKNNQELGFLPQMPGDLRSGDRRGSRDAAGPTRTAR
jgi:hypothetical protein